jgi:hypothetical protein
MVSMENKEKHLLFNKTPPDGRNKRLSVGML